MRGKGKQETYVANLGQLGRHGDHDNLDTDLAIEMISSLYHAKIFAHVDVSLRPSASTTRKIVFHYIYCFVMSDCSGII